MFIRALDVRTCQVISRDDLGVICSGFVYPKTEPYGLGSPGGVLRRSSAA